MLFGVFLIVSCSASSADRRDGEIVDDRGIGDARNRSDADRQQIFADRLASDKNGALCRAVIDRLHQGDHEALKPFIDRSALVERALKSVRLSPERAASWRRSAETIEPLSQYYFPKGSRFYCLGTFPFEGSDVLALRGRQPSGKFSYLLLHLGDNPERPFDDYRVVESGFWHSELQVFFEDPVREPFQKQQREMLMASFDGKHDAIIQQFNALPVSVQNTAVMFSHYVNAVMTVTTAGGEQDSPEFKQAADRIDAVYQDPMARAYWHVIFSARLGEKDRALAEVSTLTAPFQDPLADELRLWVAER